MLLRNYVILLLWLCNQAGAGTVTKTFTVSASVQNGCVFGESAATAITRFGDIDFGTHASLSGNLDVASTAGAGSVIVTCTPGMAVSVALGYGVNGGTSAARYLASSDGSILLPYQLYQDPSRSVVWGTDTLAYSIASFPAGTQSLTVYARLFSHTMPPSGTYTDTVLVTLTY